MKKNKIFLVAAGMIALGFISNSCEKAGNEQQVESITTAADYTAVLDMMDLNEVDEVVEVNALKSVSDSDIEKCFDLTIHDNGTSEFWPRSWTFLYVNEQCSDYFGNVKLGSVHISLTDFWKNEGSTRTITFEDFSVNGNRLEGTRTIQNTGLNESENLTFERNVIEASYTKGDTATMTWESFRDVEMIAGSDTFIASDDAYLVTGTASGVDFDGNSFEINVVDPLNYKRCGRFPVSGTITIEVENNSTIYIDYGDGECDNIAEMTIDDVTTEITL